jgi:hypothetical protein
MPPWVRSRERGRAANYPARRPNNRPSIRSATSARAGQLYDIDEDEILRLIAKRDPLLAEWRRDAVPLAGTDIARLLRDLGYRANAPKRTAKS